MRRIVIVGGILDGGTAHVLAAAALTTEPITLIRNVPRYLSVMSLGEDIPIVAPAPEEAS